MTNQTGQIGLELAIVLLLINLAIEAGVHTEHDWHPTMTDITNMLLRLVAIVLLIACAYC